MKHFLAIFITLISVFSISGARSHSANTTTPTIVETWRLVAYEDHPDGGQIASPFGKKPVGRLIYDSTGHMSIQIMKTPHPKVASGDDDKIETSEKIAVFDAYVAYFGTYSVDWKKHVVTHKIEGDLFDVYVGTAQDRPFELSRDRLTLVPTWTKEGTTVKGFRIFERVK